MRTFNIRYRSVEKLNDFLRSHGLKNQKKLLVQVFTSLSSSSHILALSTALQEALPYAIIAGCSTDGEIIDGKVLKNNTVILITEFEKTTIEMLFLEENSDASGLGLQISNTLIHKETKALILLATFQSLNAQTLLETIYHDKPENSKLVISGALAADNGKFKNSFIFDRHKVINNGILAIALSGESLIASNHYIHDWEPISKEFKVNKVENCRVIEVDNKPAKKLYNQYIGSIAEESLPLYSLQFPFVVKRKGQHISKLAIADPKDGSLIFTSNIKKGEILQISFANVDKVDENRKILFDDIVQYPAETLFVYASSARRRFIEHFSHKEVEVLKDIATMGGFFGFSEFYANSMQCTLLSQSLTVLVLSESTECEHPLYHTKKKMHQGELDYKTVKVLSNIAQVSSQQLQELNKKLEQRVKEGVKDNRKKDSIMIHNSKLAQLGEMMGLIAHQWRQPLSAISATATGMQIKFELDSWTPMYMQSSLQNIEDYVLHLSDTINDFTNFFKPTKRQETILVRNIIKKSLFIMSPLLTKDNVLVVKKYNSDNQIQTYPNEVVQVVLNLIKNSVNALLKNKIKNPEIYISEYQKEEKNYIDISDNAGGIDPKIIKKIFDPYFSTKDAENSMGLGLYMSKFIIEESCQGSLSVENIEDGAQFRIILDSV